MGFPTPQMSTSITRTRLVETRVLLSCQDSQSRGRGLGDLTIKQTFRNAF